MSQSSIIDVNISSELEGCTVDNTQTTSTETQKGTKRAASDQLYGRVKKTMPSDHLREEQTPNQIFDSKVTLTEAQRGTKRAAFEQLEGQIKKTMTDHRLPEEQTPGQISKDCNQVGFVSAAKMVNNVRANVQMIPELSDEELLQMTIEFEKKYPQ